MSSARSETDRGLDGLTVEELFATRRGFWDDDFTEFLLRRTAPDTRRLVDIGSGLSTAAHALLPSLARASYLGLDADPERLHQARTLLADAPYAGRVQLIQAHAERLPVADVSVDLVLSAMTLQHVADVPAALAEATRILCAGGRFVAIEPDNLSNAFYFDGALDELNAALRRLLLAERQARRPADIAIGPAVPSLLEQAGLTGISSRPYVLGRLGRLAELELLQRARRVATTAAVRATEKGDPIAREALAAIE